MRKVIITNEREFFQPTMPKRKMTIRRRRTFKKRRKATPTALVPRTGNQKMYAFSRILFLQNQSLNVPVGPGVGFAVDTYALSQLPNYTEFTALYDQYRIKKILVTWYPSSDGDTSSYVGVTNAPMFCAFRDYDDSAAPATLSDMMQRQGVFTRKFNRPISMTISPRTLTASSGVSGAALQARNTWLDCADASLTHYGIKWAISANPAATNTFYYNVRYKFFLEFKNVR